MYKHFLKRFIDIVIGLILIICFSPLFIIVTVWLYFANRGAGVFFTQNRPGKKAKVFRIIKFKTMTDERDSDGKLLADVQRLTKVGSFVRSTSIDELPQLFNVLIGDMSLIGPRPLLIKYLPLYTRNQSRRHNVRPGITGWTQTHGRNSISWKEKFELDIWYVDNISLFLDVKILWMTFLKVLKREGISATDSVSGVPFTGDKK
jgi:undecaprenyl phosphate N,N'-diacetylbacillosamine 1-phosphate transferase